MSYMMRDKNHCLHNEFFRSQMETGVAVRDCMEIRQVKLIIFTLLRGNRQRVQEKGEECIQNILSRHISFLSCVESKMVSANHPNHHLHAKECTH